jgi:hypothetical protein
MQPTIRPREGYKTVSTRVSAARQDDLLERADCRRHLLARALGVVLDEGCADGRYDARRSPAAVGDRVAHHVHAGALPCGGQYFGHGRLDAFIPIRDHLLDASQNGPGELAQELGASLGLQRSDIVLSVPFRRLRMRFTVPARVSAGRGSHRVD